MFNQPTFRIVTIFFWVRRHSRDLSRLTDRAHAPRHTGSRDVRARRRLPVT